MLKQITVNAGFKWRQISRSRPGSFINQNFIVDRISTKIDHPKVICHWADSILLYYSSHPLMCEYLSYFAPNLNPQNVLSHVSPSWRTFRISMPKIRCFRRERKIIHRTNKKFGEHEIIIIDVKCNVLLLPSFFLQAERKIKWTIIIILLYFHVKFWGSLCSILWKLLMQPAQ